MLLPKKSTNQERSGSEMQGPDREENSAEQVSTCEEYDLKKILREERVSGDESDGEGCDRNGIVEQESSMELFPDKDSGKSEITDSSNANQSTLVEQSDLTLEASSNRELDLEKSLESKSSMNSVDGDGWDGPEDPENPMNWPKWKKLGHVTMVAVIVFLVSESFN